MWTPAQWSFGELPQQSPPQSSGTLTPENVTPPKADKIFPNPLDPRLVTLCPTLNLVAVATGERQVDCFRFDGHRAFSYRRTGRATVQSIAWTWASSASAPQDLQDEVQLCVAWDDGKVEFVTDAGEKRVDFVLMDHPPLQPQHTANSGGIRNPTKEHIDYIASVPYFLRNQGQRLAGIQPDLAALNISKDHDEQQDAWAFYDKSDSTIADKPAEVIPHLSAALRNVDALEELPPLGPLTLGAVDPSFGHRSPNLFTSLAAVDTLLNQSLDGTERPINMLFTCAVNGLIRCSIDGAISAGYYGLNATEHNASKSVIRSGGIPVSRCYPFLSRDTLTSSSDSGAIVLSFLSFDALRNTTARALPKLIHTSHCLVSHVQYITQTVLDMRQAFQTMQRLPSRLIENVTRTMHEKGSELTLSAALYRLAVTGNCVADVREWLIDEIGPAQHKRWDTALNNGYTTLISLLMGCFLPAVDRTSVLISRLRVLSTSPPRIPHVTTDPRHNSFEAFIDRLDALRLLGHSVLVHAQAELLQFSCFSPWLLLHIQAQAAEEASATHTELMEKAGGIDYSLLLGYLTGPLQQSGLHAFLGAATQASGKADHVEAFVPSNALVEVLKKHSAAALNGVGSASEVLDLLTRMDDLLERAHAFGANLARALQAGVDVLDGLVLDDMAFPEIADLKSVKKDSSGKITTYALTVSSANHNVVSVHRVTHLEEPQFRDSGSREHNGWVEDWAVTYINVGNVDIIGLAILNDIDCLILVKQKDMSRIIRIPYSKHFRAGSENTGHEARNSMKIPCRTHDHDKTLRHESLVKVPEKWTSSTITLQLIDPAQPVEPPQVHSPGPQSLPLPPRVECSTLCSFPHPDGIAEFVPARMYVQGRNVLVLNGEGTRYRVYGT